MEKKFISATREYTTLDTHVPSPYFRRSFELFERPRTARISVCGLGFYELWVNGTRITKGHVAPYISNPDQVCYYDVYEVARYLVAGQNVIGVQLGNGMNCVSGIYSWNFHLAPFRSAPKLALELEAVCESGCVRFSADESFLTHPSPLLFDDLRLGEIYDARLEIPHWNEPCFDDSEWTPAIEAKAPLGIMKECEAEPVRVMREISPVDIFREGEDYIYDFGTDSAGVCTMRVRGERGQKIELWHFEHLDSEGKFYNENIKCFPERPERAAMYDRFCQTDRFICSGGEDEYTPTFTYHGFRYVRVVGMKPEQATPSLLTFCVMSSQIPRIGGFCCSDERINTVYRMVDNANRSNLFYFPTDCPHREKNGWTGDAAISADQMILQYDMTRSYREWLTSVRLSMNEEGALPGIVPTTGWGFAWGNGPSWDQVLFKLPYVLYKMRGNTEVVRENAEAMLHYLRYVMTRRSEDGTVAIGLGDWVPVDKKSHEYDAPLALTDSVAVMNMARMAEEMLSAVGDGASAELARGVYDEMREAIRRELIYDDLTVHGECQSSQAIALYYGVFDEDERERAFSHLLRFIHDKDDAFDCGFIGMHSIFCVLSDFGESELAYRMITRDSFPSYTLLIDEGYTALPEKFHRCGGGTYDLSMNHHFLGDVSRWLMTRLAGLDVVDSHTVRIRPCPVSGVDFAEAYYDLPCGRVSVRWERVDGDVRVTSDAPTGVRIIE